ncbi:MAG TPA: arylesterase [Bryobacteraceae bacterium]|nr:arylesterase [Bryobacteraceae bacterium]
MAFSLVGCSGRQEKTQPIQDEGRTPASQSSAPTPAPKPADDRPVIVAFGDSLTAGVVENTYPQYLQDLLDKNGYQYRVENQGVSGDTTTDGLARIENVLSAHPVLVILEFGGNDGLRGLPVDATQQNLAQMIERLQAAKIPIALLGITLPPNYGPDYLKGFNAMYPALAHKYRLPLFPFLLVHVYQHRDFMQPDGIHPSGEGNKVVAQDVFALIQPLLKRTTSKSGA